MTVRGRIRAERMGVTLTHEHLLANFNPHTEGAKEPVDYGRDEVLKIALPTWLVFGTWAAGPFIDATAVGLGRDVRLLRRLSSRAASISSPPRATMRPWNTDSCRNTCTTARPRYWRAAG
jgi:predicted metal-dependent phosphotriesterase family hydrolase